MLQPADEYSQRRYLVDAARAFCEKVRFEHRSYFPPYHGVKVRWNWATILDYSLAGIVGLAAFLWLGNHFA